MPRSFNCCSIVAFKDDQAGAKTSAVAFWIFDDLGRSLSSQSRRRGEGEVLHVGPSRRSRRRLCPVALRRFQPLCSTLELVIPDPVLTLCRGAHLARSPPHV